MWLCWRVVNPGCSSYLGGRAPSIPEGQDLSRSSSNASSLASVVEENDTEATEDYDTGMVSALFSMCACKIGSSWSLICMYPVAVSLLCTLSRRVCRLPGRHRTETPSPTAPGWRRASAAPVPPVVVTPQVRQVEKQVQQIFFFFKLFNTSHKVCLKKML